MAWVYLVLASVFEIAGAIFLKNADGFTRLGPTVLTIERYRWARHTQSGPEWASSVWHFSEFRCSGNRAVRFD